MIRYDHASVILREEQVSEDRPCAVSLMSTVKCEEVQIGQGLAIFSGHQTILVFQTACRTKSPRPDLSVSKLVLTFTGSLWVNSEYSASERGTRTTIFLQQCGPRWGRIKASPSLVPPPVSFEEASRSQPIYGRTCTCIWAGWIFRLRCCIPGSSNVEQQALSRNLYPAAGVDSSLCSPSSDSYEDGTCSE